MGYNPGQLVLKVTLSSILWATFQGFGYFCVLPFPEFPDF